jgi:DNA-binding MarR family transcriptional regulator
MADPVEAAPNRSRSPQAIESSLAIFGRRNIGVLLQQLSRDFERRTRGALQTRGHTELLPSHQVVFASLGRTGTRLTVLAQHAGMTKQAMGQIVDDLEQLGYVERTPDPEDGRAKIVRFTPAGLGASCATPPRCSVTGSGALVAFLTRRAGLDQLQGSTNCCAGARRDPVTS